MGSRSWRYDPAVSRRDLRLDLLRGLCLAKMIFNHLWKTPAHTLQPWLGFVTAAEGFFLLSGTVAGIVHGRRAVERGWGKASRGLLQRSLNLYLANLALVFLFLALEVTEVVPRSSFGYPQSFSWLQPFELKQPYFLYVLPRYVAFLAAAPLALWFLTTGRTAWLLAISIALWLANLAHAGGLLLAGPETGRDAGGIPLLSWQLLFFVGMALGHHRERLASWRPRILLPAVAGALLALCVLFALYRTGHLPWQPHLSADLRRLLLARQELGPLRLVNFAGFAALAFLLTDRFWRPLERFAGPVLLPFGQHSLYLFLLHIPVVWFGRIHLPAISELAPHWILLAADAAVLALLWLAVRRRFLFGFVPS